MIFGWILFAAGLCLFSGTVIMVRTAGRDWPSAGFSTVLTEQHREATLEKVMHRQVENRLDKMEQQLEMLISLMDHKPQSQPVIREKKVSDQYLSQFDQIVRMKDRGATLEEIAKKLKMHKGEVQLLYNLSKKS